MCHGNMPGLGAKYPKCVCIVCSQRHTPKPSLWCQLPGGHLPSGLLLHPNPSTQPSSLPWPPCPVPAAKNLPPEEFFFFFFFQKNHQVIKFNLRTCRELLMRKCLAISPQPACRNVLLWLVFIGMDVSGVCNLGTQDVNSLESKGSYCREGCSWD